MKAHLICSDIPLEEGKDYFAACGDVIQRAVWVYMFDTDHSREFLASLSAVTTCSHCYRKELEERYVYGMVSADELKRKQIVPEEICA